MSEREFRLEHEYQYNRKGPKRWIWSHVIRYPLLPLLVVVTAVIPDTPAANKKKQEEAAPGADGETPPTYAEKVGGWFENARSIAPGESHSGEPLVSCRTGGKTLFTKRADCLARGGQPG